VEVKAEQRCAHAGLTFDRGAHAGFNGGEGAGTGGGVESTGQLSRGCFQKKTQQQ